MFKKILIALVAIVLASVVFIAMQSSEFRIERSANISAPPAEVFAQVNDFHKWQAWSPWAKLDPAAKTSFEGAASGKGAIFKWNGNDKVGEGIMTITESRPSDLIRINLEFVRPFAGTNATVFTFTPKGNETVVTWTMSGKKNFVSKAICLFMNMDKTVGREFEQGLKNMKAVVEPTKK